MSRTEIIKKRLTEAFAPSLLEIRDDSSHHAGHSAMKGLATQETHFTLHVVSEKFAGKSRIERHRMVNDRLKDLFAQGLHALSIQAKAPGE